MDSSNQASCDEAPSRCFVFRAAGLFTGDMHVCGEWVKRQAAVIQLLDWTLRGVSQVMFINNPLSGLLITAGVVLQNPWWALNGLLAAFVSTASALLLGQNREAISVGLFGYNGTLVGMLMAVFSAEADWYWWLLLPNVFMAALCPIVCSALSSVCSKWDLPILTLPFDILVCLHVAATGVNHPYFPQVDMKLNLHPPNNSMESLDFSQLLLSVPLGVSQVFGCDSPWTGGLVLLAVLLSSPTICFQAVCGSAVGALSGLALAAPHEDIYSGLWGYNSALSCITIGGLYYVLTWQTQILALLCALFSAYMTAAISKLMSVLALPASTWPFCLSTLIFLLISSEIRAICRLPLCVVSSPEKGRRCQRQPKASEKAVRGREEATLKENGGPEVRLVVDQVCRESELIEETL